MLVVVGWGCWCSCGVWWGLRLGYLGSSVVTRRETRLSFAGRVVTVGISEVASLSATE
jgi:hypothetical protein